MRHEHRSDHIRGRACWPDLWALFGGVFSDVPPPNKVTEVTAISADDYAALMAPEQSPEAVANVDTPEPPEAARRRA